MDPGPCGLIENERCDVLAHATDRFRWYTSRDQRMMDRGATTMRLEHRLLAYAMGATTLAGCGETAMDRRDAAMADGDAVTDTGVADPWCVAETALVGGTACAIRPSATNVGMSDAFGYHVIAMPSGATAATPLYIFFKGSGGKPFEPATSTYLGSSLLTMQEAIDHGRIGIVVAYDNMPSIDLICGDDLDCYGAVRTEILQGIEANDPSDAKHVRPPNDAMTRLGDLLPYVAGHAPGRVPTTIDWATTRLGGGSQGGGHAAYLAKFLQQVEWVCNLAGLGDGSVSASEPATWTTSTVWITPITRMRAVMHEQDQYFARTMPVWGAFGFVVDDNARLLSAPAVDPHNFVVSADPIAVAARLWACFE